MGVWSGSQDVPEPCRARGIDPVLMVRLHMLRVVLVARIGGRRHLLLRSLRRLRGRRSRSQTEDIDRHWPTRIDKTRVYITPALGKPNENGTFESWGSRSAAGGKAELRGSRKCQLSGANARRRSNRCDIVRSGNSHCHRHRHEVRIAACGDAGFDHRTIVVAGVCF